MVLSSSQDLYQPTIKDILLLPLFGDIQTNPNGTKVAYCTGYMNLNENKINSYCCIQDLEKESTYYLTRTGSLGNFHWVNNETLAVMKRTDSAPFQIFLFESLVGEGFQVTDHAGGINDFQPFANGFVFIANNPEKDEKKKREARFGNFIQVENEKSISSLYYVDTGKMKEYNQLIAQSLEDEHKNGVKLVFDLGMFLPEPVKIESVIPSSTNDSVFLNCRSKDDLVFGHETSHYRIQFNSETIFQKGSKPVVTKIDLPEGAKIVAISPDGAKLLILYKKRDNRDYTQADLWILNVSDIGRGNLQEHLSCITSNFDRDPLSYRICWTKAGIFITYWDESQVNVARLSEAGAIEVIDLQGLMPNLFFHVNDLGIVSFLGFSPSKINDVYMNLPTETGRKTLPLTHSNDLVTNWDLGTVESIRWTSRDGTEIEGILRKPSNFDPSRKYPLLINIHGGPHHSSANALLEGMDKFYYPLVQFTNKNILILKPNYRGSLGKGQAFKELLIDNVGVGDLWDLESAIDYLVRQGFVDETKIGACGGSQGAYISAFAAMHSNRFCAVSGCSTLSSWATYFFGSDSRYSIPFSGNSYRSKGPFDTGMKETFEKTAPMNGINNTRTPILLQHGENDERVPLYSSKMIHRALKEKGIQTELFIFPGMGHSISKPRENYAVLIQNYRWFLHHLLGEELDFFKDDEKDQLEYQSYVRS
ncbi:MAG: S9 family peptidase [Candidatus Heimdallarchaeota archaeon]|nr:MAG: S9 family peptidase [Candidatus Heimdallarchaeota archaeon]